MAQSMDFKNREDLLLLREGYALVGSIGDFGRDFSLLNPFNPTDAISQHSTVPVQLVSDLLLDDLIELSALQPMWKHADLRA